MLRLSFRTAKGESPKLIQSTFVRFCADGTLRGPENYLVARRADGGWLLGGRLHRELECEGPVRLRINGGVGVPLVHLGPFALVRTVLGEFYGDEARLHVSIPGAGAAIAPDGRELTMYSEGVKNGQAQLPARSPAEGSGAQGAPAGKAAAQAVPRGRGRKGNGAG